MTVEEVVWRYVGLSNSSEVAFTFIDATTDFDGFEYYFNMLLTRQLPPVDNM